MKGVQTVAPRGDFCAPAPEVAPYAEARAIDCSFDVNAPEPKEDLTTRELQWSGMAQSKVKVRTGQRLCERSDAVYVLGGIDTDYAIALRLPHDNADTAALCNLVTKEERVCVQAHFSSRVKNIRTEDEARQLEADMRAMANVDPDQLGRPINRVLPQLEKRRPVLLPAGVDRDAPYSDAERSESRVTVVQDVAQECEPTPIPEAEAMRFVLMACRIPKNAEVKKANKRAPWREIMPFRTRAGTAPFVSLCGERAVVVLVDPVSAVSERDLSAHIVHLQKRRVESTTRIVVPADVMGTLRVDLDAQGRIAVCGGDWARLSEECSVRVDGRAITSIRSAGDLVLLGTHQGEVHVVDRTTGRIGAVYRIPCVEPVWDAQLMHASRTMMLQGSMGVNMASSEYGRLEVHLLRPVGMAGDDEVMAVLNKNGYLQVRAMRTTGVLLRFDPLPAEEDGPLVRVPYVAYRAVHVSGQRIAVLDPMSGRVRAFYME